MREVEGVSCEECRTFPVYYPEVHHLDGNRQNNLPTNLVLVCPKCRAHLLFRFNYEDIWILKIQGLSNAEIGRRLGISRQRVWKILQHRLIEQIKPPDDKIDDLVAQAMQWQEILIMGPLRRREENLRDEQVAFKVWKARLSSSELRIHRKEIQEWADSLEEERLKLQEAKRGKRRRISKRRMRAIIISEIDKSSSEKGGKSKGGKRR
jgi:hypothetical protein